VFETALKNIRSLNVWALFIVWELHNLHFSPNIVRLFKRRKMRWVGHVARVGNRSGVCRILVRKTERKRQIGRSRRSGRIILIWNKKIRNAENGKLKSTKK
jgi:hypothetical protein